MFKPQLFNGHGSLFSERRTTFNRAVSYEEAFADALGDGIEQVPWIPSFARKPDAGHQPVNADWIRFNPTNAVRINHPLLTQITSATLIRIKLPAIIFTTLSIVIVDLLELRFS